LTIHSGEIAMTETETLLTEAHLVELLESVYSAMLSLPVSRDTECDNSSFSGSVRLAASVHISGAWNGTILYVCTEQFARRAAAVLLSIPESRVTLSEVHDATAELANIIGGGIKSILPGPSSLSLPTVTHGSHYNVHVPRTSQLARIDCTCLGEPIQLRVLQAVSN
jgi:chemotaxis protein CheX